jgi:hypothetical protein
MDDARTGEVMTPKALAEVQRVYGLLREATDKEYWRLAELMVSKKDSELFGRTEFQIRDHLLRMGAQALEATVNDRKKGGTKAAASPVPTAATMPRSRGGDPGRS